MEAAPEGTVVRESVDSLGESTQRLARWQPTGTVLELDVAALAPSPLDGVARGGTTTKHERTQHAAALETAGETGILILVVHEDHVFVDTLAVAPSARRRGVGRELRLRPDSCVTSTTMLRR